jgi:urea transport system substrate-binding protein
LIYVDAGHNPPEVAAIVRTLIDNNVIEALIGMHDSDVRQAVIDANKARVPYIYTSIYEGGEKAPGVFVLGETAQQQTIPVIPWLMAKHDVKRWYLIGNDYSWPHKLNALAKQCILDAGGEVVAQHYVSFETDNFSDYMADIRASKPDCVMMSLVGNSSVEFNRAFAAEGLSSGILRFGPMVEENTLLAAGPESGENLFSAAAYFTGVDEPANQKFKARYIDIFGANAPVITCLGQSCYEGLIVLEKLAARAGSLDVADMSDVSEGLETHSPRGKTTMHDRHTIKNIYLAKADGLDFRIIETFKNVAPF